MTRDEAKDVIAKLQRVGNIVAALAHPNDDHCDNELEDEAHDLLREARFLVVSSVDPFNAAR